MSQSSSSLPASRSTQVEDELTDTVRKSLVTEVVMYVLSQEASKIPTKRKAITKTILQHHSRSITAVMREAKDVLSNVFGYHLLEFEGKYLLTNKFNPSKFTSRILGEPKEHRVRCNILLPVISLIFMEAGPVKEDDVFDFLKKLKIDVDRPDPYFGDVKRFLTKDCVQMLYLIHRRRQNTDPAIYEFSIGFRGHAEVPKRSLLNFVAKVHGNEVENWPSHLEVVQKSEGADIEQLIEDMNQQLHTSYPQQASSQPSSSQQSRKRNRRSSPSPGPSSRH